MLLCLFRADTRLIPMWAGCYPRCSASSSNFEICDHKRAELRWQARTRVSHLVRSDIKMLLLLKSNKNWKYFPSSGWSWLGQWYWVDHERKLFDPNLLWILWLLSQNPLFSKLISRHNSLQCVWKDYKVMIQLLVSE